MGYQPRDRFASIPGVSEDGIVVSESTLMDNGSFYPFHYDAL